MGTGTWAVKSEIIPHAPGASPHDYLVRAKDFS